MPQEFITRYQILSVSGDDVEKFNRVSQLPIDEIELHIQLSNALVRKKNDEYNDANNK